jgi:hypothetical protein
MLTRRIDLLSAGTERMNVREINLQLEHAYQVAFASFAREFPSASGLSSPFLIRVPETFALARVKLVIIGQETYGWGPNPPLERPSFDSPAVARGMQDHQDFGLGQGWLHTPFWQAAHQLYRMLNPGGPDGGFIWTNLVRMDQDHGPRRRNRRPQRDVEDRVCGLRLLESELELLRPDVVVFFTGPSYDDRLRLTFPSIQFMPVARTLCRLESPDTKGLWVRSYHPRYLRMKRHWSTLDSIVRMAQSTIAN